MAPESEGLRLAGIVTDAIRLQIALNCACARKCAVGEKPSTEELAELHAAIGISLAARNAFIDHLENLSVPLATPAGLGPG